MIKRKKSQRKKNPSTAPRPQAKTPAMVEATLNTILSELKRIEAKDDDRFQFIKSEFQAVRSEFKSELKTEISALRVELKSEISELRDDLKIVKEQTANTYEAVVDLRGRVTRLEDHRY